MPIGTPAGRGGISTGLLGQVRTACAGVSALARHVRIDEAAIPAYAASLDRRQLARPQMDPACHYLGQGEGTIAFLLTLDAVNFGSGYFPFILGPRQSGYRSIAAALTGHFLRHGPISAEELARMTADDCSRLFGLAPGSTVARELLARFAWSLSLFGEFVQEEFGGDFSRLVAAAGGSAEALVAILAPLPSFADAPSWRGRRVPFYKRAQLAAADLFIAFDGEGPGRFEDIASLTICADNLVPHVLRWDGILRYLPGLASRIDRGELLAAGSEEEIEIRAAAVHAGELLVTELNRQGRSVDALHLDNYLWHRGQLPFFRTRLRHRTRTVFY